MRRCRISHEQDSVDILRLDYLTGQPPDVICFPAAVADGCKIIQGEQPEERGESSTDLTLELHPPGCCELVNQHVTLGVSLWSASHLGNFAKVGTRPFPTVRASLSEDCYLVSRTALESGGGDPVRESKRSRKRPQSWQTEAGQQDGSTPQCKRRRTDAESDRRLARPLQPASDRYRFPMLSCWLQRRMCRSADRDFPMPTLAEADSALCRYCDALCLHVEGKYGEAKQAVDDMTDDDQLLGHCLFTRALAPTLKGAVLAWTQTADWSLIYARTLREADRSDPSQLRLLLQKVLAEDKTVSGTIRAHLRGLIDDKFFEIVEEIGRNRKRKKSTAGEQLPASSGLDVIYSCDFEDAPYQLGKRMGYLSCGRFYMDVRVAVTVCVRVAGDKRDEFQVARGVPGCLEYSSSPDIVAWITHVRTSVEQIIAAHVGTFQIADPTQLKSSLERGPLCAFYLQKNLGAPYSPDKKKSPGQHWLCHFDRVHLLAMLLDCGLTHEESVSYLWDRMSPTAQKSCTRKNLEADNKSWHMVQRGTMIVKCPATRTCIKYAQERAGAVGCPWATQEWYDNVDALMQQGLQSTDIEDIGNARYPDRLCMKHYEYMWKLVGKPEKATRPEQFRPLNALSFVGGLYPLKDKQTSTS